MRAGLGVLAAGLMLGCVNGDDSTGPPPGSLGGACLTNGTCDQGLECQIIGNKALCEQPDATVDAGGDVSPPVEGGSDGGTDATAECGTPVATYPCNGQHCYTDAGMACCLTTNTCASQCSSPSWACVTYNDCTSGEFCCVTATVSAGPCGTTAIDTGLVAQCAQTCSSGAFATCQQDNDCPNPNTQVCKAVALDGQTVGFCM
jgi:hypothetical protein